MLHAQNRLVRHFDPEHASRAADPFQVRAMQLCDDLDSIGATGLAWLLKTSWTEMERSAECGPAGRLAALDRVEREAFQRADEACVQRARDPRSFRVAIRAWLAVADVCNELRTTAARTC